MSNMIPEAPPLALTVTELEVLAGVIIKEIGADAVAAGTPPGTATEVICARLEALVPRIYRLKTILAALHEARSCRERTPSHGHG